MNGKDIRNNLTTNDIIKYVTYLGARVGKVTDEEINFQTICHGKLDSKHKLYYYTNNKTFYCYNNCGLIGDIFKLTESVLDLSSSEAFKYVCKFFNIPFGLGVDFLYDESSWGMVLNSASEVEELEEYKPKRVSDIEIDILDPIKDQHILNLFLKHRPVEWLCEGITVETMEKYDIRFNVKHNSIVIPHHNINSDIVGIRVRNLEKNIIEEYGKYNPLFWGNTMYNHKLSNNLYGLDKNANRIMQVKKAVIFESEKAVLQMDSFFKEKSVAVAVCGSNLSKMQMKMLLSLGVEEVILAMDKQYDTKESEEKWLNKIIKMTKPLVDEGIKVSRIWDDLDNGYLGHKDSPTDLGREVYLKLVKSRIDIN